MKILIVDDDPISLRVLREYLHKANYAYIAAKDGAEAWQILQQPADEISLVIADRIMPHLHGLELLARMQQHPVAKNIPLIMLTGVAEKEEMLAAIRAGVTDFLYKPITQELLLAVIKRVLG